MGLTRLLLLILVSTLSSGVAVATSDQDSFHEELFIKELPDGKVYTHFQFTTRWNMSLSADNAFQHFRLFPKSLGEVLHRYSVQELHLSMTQGLWRDEKWGYQMADAPPGAQLWVWFADKKINVDSTWTDLIHVLSGMFCASLNFMDLKSTVTPTLSFRPLGVTTPDYDRWYSKYVRYATLPREIVCTENLTPWKKLLPCSYKAGLSTLFNAIKLYDTSYHSLAVHFRPVCIDSDCRNVGVELSQTMSLVFDPVVHHMSSGNKWDWSFKKLFGRMITSSCALATTSTVYVDISKPGISLTPLPSRTVETVREGGVPVRYAVYNVPEFVVSDRVLNLNIKHDEEFHAVPINPPTLTATQFQTGSGQATGGVMCLLRNSHDVTDLVVVYHVVVPWFIRTYLHTLDIQTFNSSSVGVQGVPVKPLHVHFVPGKDRQRPYHLEIVLLLPARSVTRLSFQFERQLLKWLEYPPDANHGFYIGSATVSAVLPDAKNYTALAATDRFLISSIFTQTSQSQDETLPPGTTTTGARYFVRLYTESLLVALPTPDFSMPYNVICLACTVIAIVFGSVHNLTTRRFVLLDPMKHKGLLTRVKERITAIKEKIFKGKKSEVKAGESAEVKGEAVGGASAGGGSVQQGERLADSRVGKVSEKS